MRLFFLFLAIAGNFKSVDAVQCIVGTLIDKHGSIHLHEWTVKEDKIRCKVEFHDDCSITLNIDEGHAEVHHRSCETDGCNADAEKYIGEARDNNAWLSARCEGNYNKAITRSRPYLSKLRPIECPNNMPRYPNKDLGDAPDIPVSRVFCSVTLTDDCGVNYKYVKPDKMNDVGKCKKIGANVVCHCSNEDRCNDYDNWVKMAEPFMSSDYIGRCKFEAVATTPFVPFGFNTESFNNPNDWQAPANNNPNEGQAPVNNNQQYYQYYQEGSISVAVTTTLVSVVLLVVA